MNNRGQVLTLFILMLPLFVILLVLTIDISDLIINKLEIDNINKILIDYSLDNKNESNMEELVTNLANLNDDKLEIDLNINNDTIDIVLNKQVKGIITKQKIYDLKSHYKGYFENDNKIIKRIKGDNNES